MQDKKTLGMQQMPFPRATDMRLTPPNHLLRVRANFRKICRDGLRRMVEPIPKTDLMILLQQHGQR